MDNSQRTSDSLQALTLHLPNRELDDWIIVESSSQHESPRQTTNENQSQGRPDGVHAESLAIRSLHANVADNLSVPPPGSLHVPMTGTASQCASFIKAYYPFEDSLFASQILPNGWLVPSMTRIDSCRHAELTLKLDKSTPNYGRRENPPRLQYSHIIKRWVLVASASHGGYHMLGPRYALFLSTFSASYKRVAGLLLRICERCRPDFAWNVVQLERIVMQCAAGGRDEVLMGEAVRRVGDGGVGVNLWESLPWSV